jgi:hypothetical protein
VPPCARSEENIDPIALGGASGFRCAPLHA